MIPALIFLLFFFSAILIKSAEMMVVALRRIARSTHTGVFALSAIILALGTSFPELSVAVTSALGKVSSLSLGVVIGSNIANISLVGGLAAFIAGKVHVQGDFLKRDVWIALAAGILPVLLVIDGHLSRVDGLILLAVYAAYATSFFKKQVVEIGQEQAEESFWHRFLRRFNHLNSKRTREYGRLFMGIALLLFSANVIVKITKQLAIVANLPVFLIGLILLAIGTSLPELAFSFRSLGEHEPSMFFGNLLGSTIANSTLIVGVAALINPTQIVAFREYSVAAVTFLIVFLTFWLFIRTKHRLDRWEASILFALYLIFVVVEFL